MGEVTEGFGAVGRKEEDYGAGGVRYSCIGFELVGKFVVGCGLGGRG